MHSVTDTASLKLKDIRKRKKGDRKKKKESTTTRVLLRSHGSVCPDDYLLDQEPAKMSVLSSSVQDSLKKDAVCPEDRPS